MTNEPIGWLELFDPDRADTDSVVPFLSIAHALAGQARVIVDVGCGRGAWASTGPRSFQDFRAPGRTVIGVDVDPIGEQNPMLDEFRLIDAAGRWPLGDGSVDLAVSDFTLEHVTDPAPFVAELTRVLRSGGAFVARTVSRHSVLAFAARSVPNDKHPRVLARLQPSRAERDVFPTAYGMNTEADLHRLLDDRYEWAVAHRGGLEQYLTRWPGFARSVAAVEPRLPKAMRSMLVLAARKL